MLSDDMHRLIRDHTAGMVATVNADGTPAVSPKATFVVVDDRRIAFGNIRSPGTLANLKRDPAVEVCFIDVLTRKAVRVTGKGEIIRVGEASGELISAFEGLWAEYLPHMSYFVVIDIDKTEMILSPAYDLGHDEDELKAANLARLQAL